MIEDHGAETPVCGAGEIGRLAPLNDMDDVKKWRGLAMCIGELMGFQIDQTVTRH